MGKKAKRKKHLTPVVGYPGKNNNKFLTDDDRVFIDEQVAKHKKEIERMREELEKLKNQKLFTPIELGKKRIYFALLRFEFWHPISDNPDKEFRVFYKEISSLIRKAGEDLHKYAGVAEMASDKLWRFIPEFYRPLSSRTKENETVLSFVEAGRYCYQAENNRTNVLHCPVATKSLVRGF
ncbi:hypothetical protein [Floridanema evergladense]|uniref:Uncharacterized protein n=1 Tax=Floridaenema evergladense BLCC-F167 TaxID=3153639 RepID=A0ABV4WIU3_9CYAN